MVSSIGEGLFVLAFVAIIAVLGGVVGHLIGGANAERRIAQDCSADGQFEIERNGIAWVYTCSKPKLAPIEPWSE